MADLIERYKITANLPSVLINYCNRFNSKQLESITEMIYELENSIESADVQPVKHGYWEEVTDYGGWGDTHYRCSVCGEEWYLEDGKPKDNNMNFFPRCGAKLDGDTVLHDRCSNYMVCDGSCFIDDTPCDCDGNIEKCKGR